VKWVKLGCSLLSTLMSSSEGVRYLGNEDQLLSQIVRGFAQLDPVYLLFVILHFCSHWKRNLSSMDRQIRILFFQRSVSRIH
jgi:hypothetical protein